MNFVIIYFSLIKLTKTLSDQNINRNGANLHYISSNFRTQIKLKWNLINNLLLKEFTSNKIQKTEKKDKLLIIPKNSNPQNNNSTNNDPNYKDDEEKNDTTLFQKLMKVISTLLIIFLVIFIIFIIIYLILVKSGIKTNFNFTQQLNRFGIISNDNEGSSNELDIKAILGEVKTSDSESLPMDENEDINNQNEYNQEDTENNKNTDKIETINESS